jgi:hypothetical protein
LRYQLFARFLIFWLGGMRFLWFLTPHRPIFPESQRHCAAQHPRGELVNDAGTFALPTFCHAFDILAWGNAFPVVLRAMPHAMHLPLPCALTTTACPLWCAPIGE